MSSSLKQRVSSGLVWSFAQLWGVRVVSFAQLVVVTRILTPDDIGIISLAVTLIAVVEGILDLGFTEAIQQLPTLDERHIQSAFACISGSTVLLFVAALASAPWLAEQTGRGYLRLLLPVLALTLPFNASVAVPNALLTRNLQYRVLAVRSVTSSSVAAVVGIVAALAGFAYWSIAIRILVEAVLGCILTWRVSPWRPSFGFSIQHWRELFATSKHTFSIRVLNLVSGRLDSLVLGVRVAPSELGIYSTAQRACNVIVDSLFGAINQVTLPAFAQIRNDAARSSRVLIQVAKITSYGTFPAFALAAVSANDLVTLIYGSRWQASGPVLAVLCVGGWLFSISFFNAAMLTAVGRADVSLRLVALNAVTNAAAFVLGSSYGALGVAFAFVVRGYLVYPINLFAMHRVIGLPVPKYLSALGPTAVCSLAAAGASRALADVMGEAPIALRVLCSAATGLLTYLLLSFVVFRRHTLSTLDELSSIHPAFARAFRWLPASLRACIEPPSPRGPSPEA